MHACHLLPGKLAESSLQTVGLGSGDCLRVARQSAEQSTAEFAGVSITDGDSPTAPTETSKLLATTGTIYCNYGIDYEMRLEVTYLPDIGGVSCSKRI